MPIIRHPSPPSLISEAAAAELGNIPVAIIGDELNRSQMMHGALKPLGSGRFYGTALTVECMAGDNGPLHFALEILQRGQVLVADARGHIDTAVWGEIMHTCAKSRGAAAVVIDGAMRDSVAIAASGLPAFVRGVCPRGPHKGWGGAINKTIQCAGVSVSPGDLLVGDEDGIIVISPDQTGGLAERCNQRIARETETLRRVAAGETTVSALGFPAMETFGK